MRKRSYAASTCCQAARHHAATPAFADIVRADGLDGSQQGFQIGVVDGVAFTAHRQVLESGLFKRRADSFRRVEGQCVAVLVDPGESAAQLVESFRPQRADGQGPAGHKNACRFGKDRSGVAPLDAQARPPQVKLLWGKGERLLNVGDLAGIGFMARQLKHGGGKVHTGNVVSGQR